MSLCVRFMTNTDARGIWLLCCAVGTIVHSSNRIELRRLELSFICSVLLGNEEVVKITDGRLKMGNSMAFSELLDDLEFGGGVAF